MIRCDRTAENWTMGPGREKMYRCKKGNHNQRIKLMTLGSAFRVAINNEIKISTMQMVPLLFLDVFTQWKGASNYHYLGSWMIKSVVLHQPCFKVLNLTDLINICFPTVSFAPPLQWQLTGWGVGVSWHYGRVGFFYLPRDPSIYTSSHPPLPSSCPPLLIILSQGAISGLGGVLWSAHMVIKQ